MPTTDDRPLYLRIAADLRARILSGDMPDRIPGVAILTDHYPTTSTAVVQRALAVLADEGLITIQHGKPTVVSADQLTAVEATAYVEPGETKYRMLKVATATYSPGSLPEGETELVPADAARLLKLAPAEAAVLRKQMRVWASDGRPIELIWNYYPAAIAGGTPLESELRIPGGAKRLLAEMGYRGRTQVDVTTSRPPTTEEVQRLGMPPSASALRTLRCIADEHGEPIEVSVIIKGSNVYAMRHSIDLHA